MKAYATSPLEDFKTFYRLIRIYRKYRFDHIFHYTIKANIYGSIAARLFSIPSVAVVTGLGRTFQFKGLAQRLIHQAYKLGARCSTEVWFLNREDQDRFIAEGIIKRDKTFILPSEGVNTSKFVSTTDSNKQKRIVRLLFAGRLLKDKGILQFVEAAKRILKTHDRVRFEIVGFVNPENDQSVTFDQLENWQRAGWINYLGSHEDIRPFIHRADCIVFPSYYQEGISRILLEAASMSRPIITTDQVGCRDVVRAGINGLLVEPRDTTSLITTIETMLSMSAEERIRMGHHGRALVKSMYDERDIVDIYFKKLFGVKYFAQDNNSPTVHESSY